MASDYIERAFFSGLWSKYLEHYRTILTTDELTRRQLEHERLEMTDMGMMDRDQKIRQAAKIAALSYMIAVDS